MSGQRGERGDRSAHVGLRAEQLKELKPTGIPVGIGTNLPLTPLAYAPANMVPDLTLFRLRLNGARIFRPSFLGRPSGRAPDLRAYPPCQVTRVSASPPHPSAWRSFRSGV